MAHIVYEDDLVTEYDDGTTEVRFTAAEIRAMGADPVTFGLALECGHSPSQFNPAEGCTACFLEGEARADDWMAEQAAEAPNDEPHSRGILGD